MASHLSALRPHKHSNNPHTPTQTGTVQWLTLPTLTSSVSAQAIWPKNSWCAKKKKKKKKKDAFFQLQQRQQNQWNKTKVEARNIQPGFSRSVVHRILAINYNLACGMLGANCSRWTKNDSKIMCLKELKDKSRTTESWTLAGERVQQQAQVFSLCTVEDGTFSYYIIYSWITLDLFFGWSVHLSVLFKQNAHIHTHTHAELLFFLWLPDKAGVAE